MNFNKKNIVNKISEKSLISAKDSSNLLEFLLLTLVNKAKLKSVKLSRFGTFSFKKTPERIGRNPKTKESYIIRSRRKLTLSVSNKVKENMN
jgi:integration host factor subunit alpha